ncbi:hypothetical protein GBAR_LOCUS4861 [Geodia barretti]|uniref:Uncharacterized protein n=1 Tax=Geodia barretti TaxID=519541 RepID=A0AA35W9I1_GEOBA|nr:hypothetical protein GBAR_LOCUS4861 [Geodia barretti]
MVTWTNRSSDAAVYCLYSESSSWQCTPIYTQTSPLTPGWIELVQSPTVLEDEEEMEQGLFSLLPQGKREMTAFYTSWKSAKTVIQRCPGELVETGRTPP